MGSPRHDPNRRRRAREVPEPACEQTPFFYWVGTCREEGRINVLPVRRKEEDPGCPSRVSVRHAARGTDRHHFSWKCAQVKSKAGENGQHSGEMGGSSPWTRPSAPACGDTLKTLAGDQRPIQVGDRRQKEDGSGVAIDWVTGRSYSSARRRLNVQSGQRKGRKGAANPNPTVVVRDRGH